MRTTRTGLGLVAVLLATGIAVATPHHGPDEIVIEAAQNKRSAVVFPHGEHVERVESCDTCHHTNEGLVSEDDADAEVQGCVSCHLDPEEPDTPSMREMSIKKNPFHIACIDCHKEQEKGPTKCDDCHPKE
jgi:hypothetical protein